jgi:predicted nucleotidyltransferase
MTDKQNEYLDRVRGIVLKHINPSEADIWLFGSAARGDMKRWSDIDIAIAPRQELASSVFSDLREELEESSVPYTVDVVDLRSAGDDLKAAIKEEGVRWTA